MADEVLMLAKNFDRKKVEELLPVVLTEKIDGVASDFHLHEARSTGGYSYSVVCRSRQDEPIVSVEHISTWLIGKLQKGDHLIAELYIPDTPFKDVSGFVRRGENAPQLFAYIYDFYNETHLTEDYEARMIRMVKTLGGNISKSSDLPVKLIPGTLIKTMDEFDAYVKVFFERCPDAEGLMIRALRGNDSKYKFGRSWGMQRLKPTGSHDLVVHSFEEAVDKHGKRKGMVGRINVVYCSGVTDDGKNNFAAHTIIGAGPGKLTHQERTAIWKQQKKYIGRIAEIAFKPDASYDSLREPRFLRWRDDKTQPNQQ